MSFPPTNLIFTFRLYNSVTLLSYRNIQEADLLKVMEKEDIANFCQLLEGPTETKSISEASFRRWMVN